MPSTTVHLPDKLLNKIDQIVYEIGISRNKFIIKACEEALQNSAGRWPQDFFEPDLSVSNLRLLKEGVAEMEEAIVRMRKNRTDSIL
jgi:metal-responsive CopG/Arc/MetJ family transcriptional regulator